MTEFDRLGRKIAQEQDTLRAHAPHRAQVRETIDALDVPQGAPFLRTALRGRIAGARGRWLAAGVGVATAAAIAAAWFLFASRSAQAPLTAFATLSGKAISVGAWIEASGNEAFAIRFSDGSHLEIASHARARLVELDANGAHLLLESGRAQLEVAHRPHARWRVSAGPFAVRVVGTRFDVQWNPEQDQFQLDLTRGAVDVSGCAFGQGYHMHAGQRLEASCKRGRFDIADAAENPAAVQPKPVEVASPAANAANAGEPARDNATKARPAIATSARPSRSARRAPPPVSAEARKVTGTRALPDEFEAKCANAGVEELASLADAAHYAGDRDREAYAWRLLRRRFPGTSRAALAAFALGRLEFDVHGSYSKAAEWFGTYLKEQPEGALVREARGRLMEATLRAGDAPAARALGAAYLRDYPVGPHADLARSLERTPSP